MAKLNRVTGKIFGATASPSGDDPEIGQFGSAKAGTYNGTSDIATIQGLPAWSNGWIDAVAPSNQYPPLPERTGVDKVLSYQECYLLQQGIPEWDSTTDYYTNGYCSYNGIIYKSLIDNNVNNQPDINETSWEVYGAISDYANQDLQNLTYLGNSRLQYAPFSINAGTVLNGENNTLTAEILYKKYNITETGSLTKNNGIISGFSTSNYANIPGTFTPSTNPWEMGFEVTTGSLSSHATILGIAGLSSARDSIALFVRDTGGVDVSLASSSSADIGTINSTNNLSANTTYTIKLEFTGSAYNLYVDNNLEGTLTSNKAVYSHTLNLGIQTIVGPATGYPWLGSINLNNSYIKISGQTWWTGSINGTSSDYDYTIGNASEITCDPCTITTCDGRTKVFNTSTTLDVSNEADGDYSIFKDYSIGNLSLISDFVISKTAPLTPSDGDYWLDISTTPANLKYYDTSDWAINNDLVYIGECTITGGAITAITNKYFNACPYYRDLVEYYTSGKSWYSVYSDGWCEQGGYYSSSVSVNASVTITLLKNFKDANYYKSVMPTKSSTSGTACMVITGTTYYNKFTCMEDGDAAVAGFAWEACGYAF